MSVVRVVPAYRIYRCDACGAEGVWGPEWRSYSSRLLDECCPEDVPHLCSAACQAVAVGHINRGEWDLPHVRAAGGGVRVTRPKRGY